MNFIVQLVFLNLAAIMVFCHGLVAAAYSVQKQRLSEVIYSKEIRRDKRQSDLKLEWTTWYNLDRPWTGDNAGDAETTDTIGKTGAICSRNQDIVKAQCRVSGNDVIFDEDSVNGTSGDVLLMPCSKFGIICLNSQQASGICQDYEIRFLCQNLPTGDANHSNTFTFDARIYVILAIVPFVAFFLRFLVSCIYKRYCHRRRLQRRLQRQLRNGSLMSTGSSTTDSEIGSIDVTLANPPPTYTELFGTAPAVFSISDGHVRVCKCRKSGCPLLSQTNGFLSVPLTPVESSAARNSISAPGSSSEVATNLASTSSSANELSDLNTEDSIVYDVIINHTNNSGNVASDETPSSSHEQNSTLQNHAQESSSSGAQTVRSLQGGDSEPREGPSVSREGLACFCSCHHQRLTLGHDNLAFSWDSVYNLQGTPPPAFYPGMHNSVFEFRRVSSNLSITELPNYDQALEMLSKNKV